MTAKAFDRKRHRTGGGFRKAFNALCAETPSKRETCQRIRDNQELYQEYQQKCLNNYDPDVQQAIEAAGDVIRELTKGGCERYDLGYAGQKVRRLDRILGDLSRRRRKS